jgi:hypothetical protein
MRHPTSLLILLPLLLACDPPQWVNCVALSPECARGEAQLRVDVINLSQDVTWVGASVDGLERSTSRVKDGTVSLYFFDLAEKPGAKVQVEVQGSASPQLLCVSVAQTGKDNSVTVNARGPECLPVVVADAGVPDAAPAQDASNPDASQPADAGCLTEPDDGGLCDGGPCCDDDDAGSQP